MNASVPLHLPKENRSLFLSACWLAIHSHKIINEIWSSEVSRAWERDYFCNSARISLQNHCDITRCDAPQTASISFENEWKTHENREDSFLWHVENVRFNCIAHIFHTLLCLVLSFIAYGRCCCYHHRHQFQTAVIWFFFSCASEKHMYTLYTICCGEHRAYFFFFFWINGFQLNSCIYMEITNVKHIISPPDLCCVQHLICHFDSHYVTWTEFMRLNR